MSLMHAPRLDRNRGLRLIVGWLVLGLSDPAFAQDAVSASGDVTIDLGASAVAGDHDVVIDTQLGLIGSYNLGGVPEASDVVALARDPNGDLLFSLDTATALTGGVITRPGDVVRYDGSTYSIEFGAGAAGIPDGVTTDATSLAAGGLLLSFDTSVDLGGGLVVADEDLVVWNGVSFVSVFDGSTEGLDPALDIDAAQDLGGGQFLMSFDTTGQIGGIIFADEDVLRFDGAVWSVEYDSSVVAASWAAADLDAVMVPEPGLFTGLRAGGLLLAGWARRRRRSVPVA